MKEENILETLRCKNCKSKNIRTTKEFRICNRCGFKEELDGNN